MKKTKQFHKKTERLTPEQTLLFLSDFAHIAYDRDEKTEPISLRVPRNVLNVFKILAKERGHKYQSVIVQLMRNWIKETSKQKL
jgi:predicted DNA binding CopG/RHH family protein